MKALTITLLLLTSTICQAQKGLVLNYIADTLYISDTENLPVIITDTYDNIIKYYIYGDPNQKERKVYTNQIKGYHKEETQERKVYMLDTTFLTGKVLYMQAVPVIPALSRFYNLTFDVGIGHGEYLLTDDEEKPVKFFSEMATINYLIGQGWELYQIQRVEQGSVGGAASTWSLFFGGEVTISQNRYFLKKQY
ncbi:hypothetical protein [Roseivirga pacifica]|uniref:hypothetical protein n=1 Tax=Roseivirga pacifica TaxID=1267423 RepID=UPI00209420F6|nr:hypothetical protein [Roseivirga pacifica]MCO6358182.1 hypothetical protein [Roseivirga pacifica]MCO6366620.1 hypothetical protein [Roseivirga pacifica]MCO6371105.1 hypothetical protein [Roseivirga pacifica]MCO6373913.1 hypothetical protein [Roseivirga pacifica]MCO6380894.1 hypothetical protein [Roseivirga pacifica]